MSALHAEILDAPTPEQVRAQCLKDEMGITDIFRFTAGDAVGVIKRFDYWTSADSVITSDLGAGIDFSSHSVGFNDIEVDADIPDSLSVLPDLAVVVTAVHHYIIEHNKAVAS